MLVFVVVLTVLLVVAVGGRFVGYLQDAALGKFAAESLGRLVAFRLPEFAQLTIPFAFYLATLLTFSRLYADQEMTVLASGGATPWHFVRWVAMVGVPLAAVVAVLTLGVTPGARYGLEMLVGASKVREFEAVTPGTFHTFSKGARVTYSERVNSDEGKLEEVFLGENTGTQTVTVFAEAGEQYVEPTTGSQFLLLEEGIRYEGMPGQGDYRVVEFGRMGQRLEIRPLDRIIPPAGIDTTQLEVAKPTEYAELHFRYGLPLLTLIGGFCAFAMSRSKPRSGRFARMLPGISLMIGYYVALLFVQNAVAEERLPMGFGFWPLHGVMLIFAFGAIVRSHRPR